MGNFLERLFGRTRQTDSQSVSVPAAPAGPALDRLVVGIAHDVGRVRSHNEDSLVVVSGLHRGEDGPPDFGLFVVADGMGGHHMGERASTLAAHTVAKRVVGQIYVALFLSGDASERPALQDVMRDALIDAHTAVSDETPDGGTTLTAALLIGHQLTLAHVGDSRAYVVAADAMDQATRDHSLVRRLQELGQISAAEAAVHPQRNVLYRALGQGDHPEVDVHTRSLSAGARLLLCSDGLWSTVPDESILSIVTSASNPQQACNRLIDAANQAGGPDNITAILVQLPG